jgi:hypothetical protein
MPTMLFSSFSVLPKKLKEFCQKNNSPHYFLQISGQTSWLGREQFCVGTKLPKELATDVREL